MKHIQHTTMACRILAVTIALSLLIPFGRAAEWKAAAGAVAAKAPGKPAEARSEEPAKRKAAEPLSPEEAESLAARAEEPGAEVAGGALSNEHLTYVVIALAAAVIVLIAK